jgi:hypothetical protein
LGHADWADIPDATGRCCYLPSRAERPPSGPEWLYEIKHDGFRIMARRNNNDVSLHAQRIRFLYDWSRHDPGNRRLYPRVPEIVQRLRKIELGASMKLLYGCDWRGGAIDKVKR